MAGSHTHQACALGHDATELASPTAVAAIDQVLHGLLAVAPHGGIGHDSHQLVEVLSHVGIGERHRLLLEVIVLLACLKQAQGLLGQRSVEEQVNLLLHGFESRRGASGFIGTLLHLDVNQVIGVKTGEILDGLHSLNLGADGAWLERLHLAELHSHGAKVLVEHLLNDAIFAGGVKLVQSAVGRGNHRLSHFCLNFGAHQAVLLHLAHDNVTSHDSLVHALNLVDHRRGRHVVRAQDVTRPAQTITTHFPQQLGLGSESHRNNSQR